MDKQTNRRSPVWQYFRECAPGKVECDLCKSHLSYTNKSTGTMANHLKLKHKLNPAVKASATRNTAVQQKITAYKSPVISKDHMITCHRKLAAMCAEDLRPISIVDGRGFKSFMANVAPSYPVPSRTTVMKYLDLDYNDKVNAVKELIGDNRVAITTDCWTSAAQEGYLTCTAHFLDKLWNPRNYVLATKRVEERHTGENLALELRTIMAKFDINDSQIIGLVTDNASNMYSCAAALEWPHFQCFAHTLQLGIKSSLQNVPTIRTAIAAGRRVATHFRKSVLASHELQKRQTQMDIPKHKLLIDSATRWNSSYIMMERLLEQRLAIYAVLHDATIINRSMAATLDITDDQWGLMERLLILLKPFFIATTVMCSEEYPTLSGIFPILYSLVDNHLGPHADDPASIRTFKELALKELKARHKLDQAHVHTSTSMVACMLDPRYKKMPFLSSQQRVLVSDEVKRRIVEDQVPIDKRDQTVTTATNQPKSNKQPDGLAFLLGGYYEEDCSIVTPTDAESEIKLYMELNPVSGNTNAYKWWSVNAATYPRLAVLARSVLCIPGTEVPSERVFSAAGGTVSKRRTLLSADNVDKLLFLHKYGNECQRLQAHAPISAPHIKVEPEDSSSPVPEDQPEAETQSGGDSSEIPPLPSLNICKMEL